MQYRKIGKSDIAASTVVLGTWGIGGGSIWGKEADEKQLIGTIHAALSSGINFIDTAPGYGFGESERIIGKAIKNRRDEVVIATKCGLVWEWEGTEHFSTDGKTLRRNLSPVSIRREVEESLKRLKTDYLDLYQVHWPSILPYKTPIEDTLGCLVELKREGKIRAIGVSNLSEEETLHYCIDDHIDTNQIRYSMLWEKDARTKINQNQRLGMSTMAYQALEQGLLSGKVTSDTQFGANDIRNVDAWNPWFVKDKRAQVLQRMEAWKPLLDKYDCTMAQLVIAATTQIQGIDFVLCGARTVKHAQQNAKAGALDIDREDASYMLSQLQIPS
ncbi:aldo/keto reductase [Vibrio nigripulchritudo ATCC 27043]|uniref:aldo/keto reductase n=1 Tax=Vibrio nigripulchritudo TaxID=28173 RepID=UPI00021C1C4B|nr:aldo/keto reductase [Vibrio nigripulchritudo]EGU54345.1 aldo/keto reductase [Vibrio nigripulchritudo ATCC 27043]